MGQKTVIGGEDCKVEESVLFGFEVRSSFSDVLKGTSRWKRSHGRCSTAAALSLILVLGGGYTSSQLNLHAGLSSSYRQKDQSDVSSTKGI